MVRIIEKDTTTNMKKYGLRTILVFRSNTNFNGFIEYTSTKKMIDGIVYRVDKSIYGKDGYSTSYFPKE